MENLVSYRSIYWVGSWLDIVRGAAEKENDTRATTDSKSVLLERTKLQRAARYNRISRPRTREGHRSAPRRTESQNQRTPELTPTGRLRHFAVGLSGQNDRRVIDISRWIGTGSMGAAWPRI